MTAQPCLVGVDWGTSRFRAYLLGPDGVAVEERTSDLGLLSVPAGAWESVLTDALGSWLGDHGPLPILLCGMVGSAQGWSDAGYVDCPATVDALAGGLHHLSSDIAPHVAVVPGVRGPSVSGGVDLMRGEETQLVGLDRDGFICLPGTHTKWVQRSGGAIEGFTTQVSGELYALLRTHSVIGRVLGEDGWDEEAFQEGLAAAQEPGGLAHHLFGVRVRGLAGGSHGEAYLSGVLLGAEISSMSGVLADHREVVVVGDDSVVARYGAALGSVGLTVVSADPNQVVIRGLMRVARAAGFVQEGA